MHLCKELHEDVGICKGVPSCGPREQSATAQSAGKDTGLCSKDEIYDGPITIELRLKLVCIETAQQILQGMPRASRDQVGGRKDATEEECLRGCLVMMGVIDEFGSPNWKRMKALAGLVDDGPTPKEELANGDASAEGSAPREVAKRMDDLTGTDDEGRESLKVSEDVSVLRKKFPGYTARAGQLYEKGA